MVNLQLRAKQITRPQRYFVLWYAIALGGNFLSLFMIYCPHFQEHPWCSQPHNALMLSMPETRDPTDVKGNSYFISSQDWRNWEYNEADLLRSKTYILQGDLRLERFLTYNSLSFPVPATKHSAYFKPQLLLFSLLVAFFFPSRNNHFQVFWLFCACLTQTQGG